MLPGDLLPPFARTGSQVVPLHAQAPLGSPRFGQALFGLLLMRTALANYIFMLPRRFNPAHVTDTTLSANCMWLTISSMFVVSPTCFCSRRLK